MKKILFFDDSPVVGGHQFMSVKLLSELSNYFIIAVATAQREWYQVHLSNFPASSFHPVLAGTGPAAAIRGLSPFRIAAAKNAVEESNPTFVIVCQGAPEMGLPGLLACKLNRVPVFSYVPICQSPKELGLKLAHIRNWVQNQIFKAFNGIVTISDAQRNMLLRRGISSRKIFILQNYLEPRKVPLVSRGKVDAIEIKIGVIGRVHFAQKGQDKLISLALLMRVKAVKIKFLIVGDGPDLLTLKKLIFDSGLSEMFAFEGWRDDVEIYYRMCDAVLSTSNFEGVPLVMLESLNSGVPFFAPNLPSFMEYLPEALLFSSVEDCAGKICSWFFGSQFGALDIISELKDFVTARHSPEVFAKAVYAMVNEGFFEAKK